MPSPIHEVLESCPAPSERRLAIRVSAAAERTLRHGHPWLYEQSIRKQRYDGQPGDLAVLYDRRERFLAAGLYDPTSPIRVRVLQRHRQEPINQRWYHQRLEAAIRLRAPLRSSMTTGYRLVHGENDELPGLVIDRYGDALVLKLYTVAWVAHLRDLLNALAHASASKRVVLRLSRAVQRQPRYLHGLADGMIVAGPALEGPMVFRENGLRFEVDPRRGQKTGFFLDQRENRARVERWAEGRAVLDVFAYTGAFSVYAARGGAREVTSLDLNRPALQAAKRNMALNQHHPAVAAVTHRVVAGEAFEVLAQLGRKRKSFDVVVLDPPAFAKTRAEVPSALSAYRRLTRAGLSVLKPGGVLMISCCSGQISADTFFTTVHQTAATMKRPLRELERTGHPLDHPIGFPEGRYLKCLFARA